MKIFIAEAEQKLLRPLYENYYGTQETPELLSSSHWKLYHQSAKVEFIDGKIAKLTGLGFGDLQIKSFSYRILSWLTTLSYMAQLSNKDELIELIGVSHRVLKRMGLYFTYDCFRQLCAWHLISQKLKNKRNLKIINIGDGYGFLSAFIKEMMPDAKICLVDLGKTLLFQAHYCFSAHSNYSHALVSDLSQPDIQNITADFIYCPAELLLNLENFSFDVAINISSMQEMTPEVIGGYFDFLRQHLSKDNLFYCCNREEKRLPAGEITRFLLYPWHKNDVHLVDEDCPWYRYFFSWRKAANGPRLWNIRIPLVNFFDGLIRHRLTILSTLDLAPNKTPESIKNV